MKREYFPLTKEQEGLWFEYKLNSDATNYNAYVIHKIEGIDIDRFFKAEEQALNHLYTTRTKFKEDEDGQVSQYILPRIEKHSSYIDLTENIQENHTAKDSISILKQISEKPFNLHNEIFFKVVLIRESETVFYYMVLQHHIISDAFSADMYFRVLSAAYNEGEEVLKTQFPQKTIKEYLTFISDNISKEKELKAKEYWNKRLQGAEINFDFGNNNQSNDVKREQKSFVLGEDIYKGIKQLAKQCKTTPFLILMGIIKVMLYRYWDKEDISMGYDINARPKGYKNVAGYFVKVFLLRTKIREDVTFVELGKDITKNRKEDSAFQDISYSEILQEYRKYNINSASEKLNIFTAQTMFKLNSLNLKDAKSETVYFFGGAMNLDLEFLYDSFLKDLQFLLAYNSNKFSADFIERMICNLKILIENVLKAPNKKISELEILTEKEKQILLVDINNTKADYPKDKTIHKLFEEQAEKTPGNTAVVFKDKKLTYKELNEISSRLAHYLKKKGIEKGSLIGIFLERSIEMVAGILGILKAGGAYVPLDPIYPEERLKNIIEDSELKLILSQKKIKDLLPEAKNKPDIVLYENIKNEISGKPEIAFEAEITANDTMYVIFTSGSSGRPKGVKICHGNVINFLNSMKKKPGFNQEDTLLAVTTISFDISVLELFLPIITGGKVVVMSAEDSMNAETLQKAMVEYQVTVMQATPSTWQMLENIGWEGSKKLKVLCGGEPLPSSLANSIVKKVRELWNMYGPTETTIWSAIAQIRENEKVTIGRPIDNTRIYILDNNLNLLPLGVPGTLYIGGDGVSAGYLNREDLTQERFIQNPFIKDTKEIIYNTGDLCRYRSDRKIVYIGRIDDQVKVRGFRIELGEIESIINQYPNVSQAVAVVRGNTTDDKTITAYIILKDKKNKININELKQFLKTKLPDYMIPLSFVILDNLPLLSNGKVDKKKLPKPDEQQRMTYAPPGNTYEKNISEAWAEILGVKQVGIHDNFFDAGGNSMAMTKVFGRLRKILDKNFTLTDMFKYPTVHSFSLYLENKLGTIKNSKQECPISDRKVNVSSIREKRRAIRNKN